MKTVSLKIPIEIWARSMYCIASHQFGFIWRSRVSIFSVRGQCFDNTMSIEHMHAKVSFLLWFFSISLYLVPLNLNSLFRVCNCFFVLSFVMGYCCAICCHRTFSFEWTEQAWCTKLMEKELDFVSFLHCVFFVAFDRIRQYSSFHIALEMRLMHTNSILLLFFAHNEWQYSKQNMKKWW